MVSYPVKSKEMAVTVVQGEESLPRRTTWSHIWHHTKLGMVTYALGSQGQSGLCLHNELLFFLSEDCLVFYVYWCQPGIPETLSLNKYTDTMIQQMSLWFT